MKSFVIDDTALLKMSEEQVEKLGLMYPAKVFVQIETSGSPSAWTNVGEYLFGRSGADIVRAAHAIRGIHRFLDEWNEENNAYGTDRRRAADAHIRIIF